MSAPYIKPDGTLFIPRDADQRYHWWKAKEGEPRKHMTLLEILRELNAPDDVILRYVPKEHLVEEGIPALAGAA